MMGYSWGRRLAFSAACLLIGAFVPFTDQTAIPSVRGLQAGDIVFIRGKSARSAVVRIVEGSYGAYSHVGLIVVEHGEPFVIHANPETASDYVRKEPWFQLITRTRIAGASVFRLVHDPGNRAGARASMAADEYWKRHLRFDHDFDLLTADRLYCTELVWRAYLTAGIDLRGHSFKTERRYLLPSDLIDSGFLRELRSSR